MSATPTLREQQLAFAAAVCGGADDAAHLLQAMPNGAPPLLRAYRHAYGARLTEALRDNFEILARVMGDEAFDTLASAYRAAHPSTVPSIRWFGHRLAEFMNTELARETERVPHPAFVDFARMDWALREAFDAADAPVLDRAALAGLAPEAFAALRFGLHPSVRLQPLDWAIEAAWRALREHDPTLGADDPELPAPEALPHTLLVWRRGLDTLWRSLEPTEAALLVALQAGESFARLCERAATLSGDVDQAASITASALAQWLDDGLLSALA